VDRIGIIGTGFVADLYMRSLSTFPRIQVALAWDEKPARLAQFCNYWSVTPARSLEDLLERSGDQLALVLNLTNPAAHYEITRACLDAGKHVYSEKPLALTFEDAVTLRDLAGSRKLLLASAPCSVLGESAQTVWWALREGAIGKPRLVYAELDDDFVTQAPYRRWLSESGAPWPAADEFRVGCTVEHAGYYLTWLLAMFGPVKTVIAASANLVAGNGADGDPLAPDFSTAVLLFESGVIARLTCSIVAPHEHGLRIIGEKGVLEVGECWDNSAKVKVRRRYVIRRRLVNSPFARRWKLKGSTHPKLKRRGAASMNFALGPAEMLSALREGRPCRLGADFALHVTEITLAIHNAGLSTGPQAMRSTFDPIHPMPWAEPSSESPK
jgi:predicted dehydrogenase